MTELSKSKITRVANLRLGWRQPKPVVTTLEELGGEPMITFRQKGSPMSREVSLPLSTVYARAVAADALARAELQWKRHKAPMALYWKVGGVYAGHLARAIPR